MSLQYKIRGLTRSGVSRMFTSTTATTFRRQRTQPASCTRTASPTCFSSRPRLPNTPSGPRPRRRCPISSVARRLPKATLRTAALRSTAARAGPIACTTTTRLKSRATLPLPWVSIISRVPPPARSPRSSTPSATSVATMVRCASSCTIRPCHTVPSSRTFPLRTVLKSARRPLARKGPNAPLMVLARVEFERVEKPLHEARCKKT
mmetsp:Transcript_89982/g.275429  ORF Transcript_89982/g.275429 Transcript_89982/m.275429 type:complete len:206 (-) Transcript_89982:118-735(-)